MTYYEKYDFKHDGYQKLFHFNSWRIATLEHYAEVDDVPFRYLECHHETDEVFVLIEGSCQMIFFKDNNPKSLAFEYIELQPHSIYRVLKGVYHAHHLSRDAKIILVEEENTSDQNSHRVYLNEAQTQAIKK